MPDNYVNISLLYEEADTYYNFSPDFGQFYG